MTNYDLVSAEQIHATATGRPPVRLPADTARVLVLHPADARRETRGGMIFANESMVGACIDPALPDRSPLVHPDSR